LLGYQTWARSFSRVRVRVHVRMCVRVRERACMRR
jgi:hypothetical protein